MSYSSEGVPISIEEYYRREQAELDRLVAAGKLAKTVYPNCLAYELDLPPKPFVTALVTSKLLVVRSGDLVGMSRKNGGKVFTHTAVVGDFRTDPASNEVCFSLHSSNPPIPFRLEDIIANHSASTRWSAEASARPQSRR